MGSIATHFNEIWIKAQESPFKKITLNMTCKVVAILSSLNNAQSKERLGYLVSSSLVNKRFYGQYHQDQWINIHNAGDQRTFSEMGPCWTPWPVRWRPLCSHSGAMPWNPTNSSDVIKSGEATFLSWDASGHHSADSSHTGRIGRQSSADPVRSHGLQWSQG